MSPLLDVLGRLGEVKGALLACISPFSNVPRTPGVWREQCLPFLLMITALSSRSPWDCLSDLDVL